MIIVRLKGGLGNQMFQYAAARCLAEHHSTIVKLDLSSFETDQLRDYSLHCFQILEYFATQTEIKKIVDLYPSGKLTTKIDTLISHIPIFRRRKNIYVYSEKHFHFDPDFWSLPNNILLEGYWQSEKYFSHVQEILQQEFTVKYPQDPQSVKCNKDINACDSIAVHIRRSDYVHNPINNKVHGTCSLDYYHECIHDVTQKVNKPQFFVFSDDHQWAKDNLLIDYPTTYITHNNAVQCYEDLRLMSQCKHNIIANSTFSWWGAWLNKNPHKLVYAPKKWFQNSDHDTRDLIPHKWIQF